MENRFCLQDILHFWPVSVTVFVDTRDISGFSTARGPEVKGCEKGEIHMAIADVV